MSDSNTLEVKILEKDFLVACPPDKKPALREAASLLDQKMREIRATGKVHGSERIAVMAALNFAYDLLQANACSIGDMDLLSHIERRLDEALTRR
jgi:cell division protein ZapA